MIKNKEKIIWAACGIVAAVAVLLLWNPRHSEHSPADASVSKVETEATRIRQPLRLRTVHGVFDLSNMQSNEAISGIPKKLLGVKSAADDENRVRKFVQFEAPIKPTDRKAVEAAGGRILGYYPDNILSVSVPDDKAGDLSRLSGVHTVADRPAWVSVQPNLFDMIDRMVDAKTTAGQDATVGLLIAGDRSLNALKVQLSRAGFEATTKQSRFACIYGTADEVKQAVPLLMTLPSVSSIQLDIPIRFTDSPEDVGVVEAAPLPPALNNNNSAGVVQTGNLGETTIWDHGLTGEGQRIIVCDTGTDPDHQMFSDPTLPPTATAPIDLTALPADDSRRKIVLYVNSHGGPTNWDEAYGHGSHVAGSMLGNYEDPAVLVNLYNHEGTIVEANLNGAEYKGMAPDAKLVVTDIGAADGSLNFLSIDDIWGPGPALGANLVNNSWGRPVFIFGIRLGSSSYDAQVKAFDEYLYSFPNLLALRAAGNDGDLDGAKTIGMESEAKNELIVGALGNGNYDGSGLDEKAFFSSEGPASDGRFRPHIMAPGHQIVSAFGDGSIFGFNKELLLMSGTSMATPTACGAITLIRQYFTDGHYAQAFSPSSALLKAMAINSGTDLYMIGDKTNATVEGHIPNSTQGWGRLTLENVLAFEEDVRQLRVWDNAGPLKTGENSSFSVNVLSDTEELRFTLAWTDPAAAANANPVIVNDLNLIVRAPSGVSYNGNNFLEGHSVAGDFTDTINTEECVYIKTPEIGTYTITVVGSNIPGNEVEGSDSQKFALVATGAIPVVESAGSGDPSAGDGGCTMAMESVSIVTLLPLMLVCCVVLIRRRQGC